MRSLLCLNLVLVAAASAAVESPTTRWSATDVRGASISIPAADKPTILVFVLPDHPQIPQVIQQVQAATRAAGDVQIVLVVDGKDAQAAAKRLADEVKVPWLVVADPDYAASGKLSVHAWPTTVVIRADGQQAGHLPGLPKSYATDLDAIVQFAQGRIDQAALHRRLMGHDTIHDSGSQMADRHLSVANRLLDKGLIDQARAELDRGLKLQPDHAGLRVAMIDVLLAGGEARAALDLIERLDEKTLHPRQAQVLRARALIALGQWEQAKAILTQAVILNPDPAAAWYLLGLVHQHEGDTTRAADAFRKAFESTPAGHKAAVSTRPTTRP